MEEARHRLHLEETLQMANDNIKKGGGPFGAMIVKEGKIISREQNQVVLHNDPTAHAEITAIRTAAKKLGTYELSGCVIYSSCEPCPMCLSAIYWAGIKEVYYANSREEAAEAGFDDLHIYDELAKNADQREVVMKRFLIKDSGKPFSEWLRLENRIEY